MNLLCTTSDASSQFLDFERVACVYELLYTDVAFDLTQCDDEIILEQLGRQTRIGEKTRVVYMPFRAPQEAEPDAPDLVGRLDRMEMAELLEAALAVAAVPIYNKPALWRNAYLKTSLLQISKLFPGLVPRTEILSGRNPKAVGDFEGERVSKCGFGVKRPVNGLLPRATRIAAGEMFQAHVPYRYVVQDYVNPSREVRTYFTRTRQGSRCTCLTMPTGTADCPDWREFTKIGGYPVSVVEDCRYSGLSLHLANSLGLDYVCFDFLENSDRIYLVDINPHGSWAFLPPAARKLINQHVWEWLHQISIEPITTTARGDSDV